MKRLILLVLILVLSGCNSYCNPNDGDVCFNDDSGTFSCDNNTPIKVAVESEEYGKALVSLWNKYYPTLPNMIEPILYEDFTIEEFQRNNTDVALLDMHHAVVYMDYLLPIDQKLEDVLEEQLPDNMLIEGRDLSFIPISAYGSVFASNLTYLEAQGIDITDGDNDGLVDSLDTMEEIIAQGFQIPFNFDDHLMSYVWGTIGFELFSDNDANDVGFDTNAFLSSLDSLAYLGQHFTETEWIYEDFFIEHQMPFTPAASFMYYNETADVHTQEYSMSAFPTVNGKALSPLVFPRGYVINKDTKNPSLAHEVLRLMYSLEGLQMYIDYTDSVLVYNFEDPNSSTLQYETNNDVQLAKALQLSVVESFVAYEKNPSVRGFEMLEDIGYYDVLKAVFNQKITPAQGQTKLVDASELWIDDKTKDGIDD